jgi:regulator of extracellular matrix RemA (YlzA/DUF370 family)
VEDFFVVVLAAVLLAVGIGALVAARRLLALVAPGGE